MAVYEVEECEGRRLYFEGGLEGVGDDKERQLYIRFSLWTVRSGRRSASRGERDALQAL